jgi:hypothetical protein
MRYEGTHWQATPRSVSRTPTVIDDDRLPQGDHLSSVLLFVTAAGVPTMICDDDVETHCQSI